MSNTSAKPLLYFKNKNQDFNDSLKGKYIETQASKVNEKTSKWIKTEIDYHLKKLEDRLDFYRTDPDYTVYSGSSGISLLYMDLANISPTSKQALLFKALQFVEKKTKKLSGLINYSFLTGDTGPLAVCAVLLMRHGEKEKSMKLLERIKNYAPFVCDLRNNYINDDLMSGRAGYLYTLLYVYKHIEFQTIINVETIRNVLDALVKSGKHQAAKAKIANLPLVYFNYDIEKDGQIYIGSLYGMCGILYMILQAQKCLSTEEYDIEVKPTIMYLISKKLPSRNYPQILYKNSDQDESTDLVQWCHGVSGMLMLFSLSYLVYSSDKKSSDLFLKEAKDCADVIWERGMLLKSYGLCHGVAGNAYALLRIYQVTHDEKYLHRAFALAEYCADFGNGNLKHAEEYTSLFEGIKNILILKSNY